MAMEEPSWGGLLLGKAIVAGKDPLNLSPKTLANIEVCFVIKPLYLLCFTQFFTRLYGVISKHVITRHN
jgi:hypothetical protein